MVFPWQGKWRPCNLRHRHLRQRMTLNYLIWSWMLQFLWTQDHAIWRFGNQHWWWPKEWIVRAIFNYKRTSKRSHFKIDFLWDARVPISEWLIWLVRCCSKSVLFIRLKSPATTICDHYSGRFNITNRPNNIIKEKKLFDILERPWSWELQTLNPNWCWKCIQQRLWKIILYHRSTYGKLNKRRYFSSFVLELI